MDTRNISMFPLTIQSTGHDEMHAGRAVIPTGAEYPGSYDTACGLALKAAPVVERFGHPTCPACAAKLYGPTIAHLVDVVTEINTANGWRDGKGDVLTVEHPLAKIAATTRMATATAEVIEGVRKAAAAWQMRARTGVAFTAAHRLDGGDLSASAADWLADVGEAGRPVYGSKTADIARIRLFDTESVELTRAIIADDVAQIEDELADCIIRPLDFAGAWNEEHPDRPIDIQHGVLRKLDKNRSRGYKHGGKTA